MKAVAAVIAALVVIGLLLAMTEDWSGRQLHFYEQVQECVDGSRNPYPDVARMECERFVKERGR
jgi:hypothetical protein